MITESKLIDNQLVEKTGSTVFDEAAKRSLDYTNLVVGHVFENVGNKEKSSPIMVVLEYILPTLFASSPESLHSRYREIQSNADKNH